MSNELRIQPGKDETAVVERVVPGRLVYVTTKKDSRDELYGFKLDQLVIRKSDGSCRPYRGEPLSDLGVTSGRSVVVWGIKYSDVEPTLVIDADRPREFGVSIGSSISSAVNSTLEIFRR
jgi:hypothetical protein